MINEFQAVGNDQNAAFAYIDLLVRMIWDYQIMSLDNFIHILTLRNYSGSDFKKSFLRNWFQKGAIEIPGHSCWCYHYYTITNFCSFRQFHSTHRLDGSKLEYGDQFWIAYQLSPTVSGFVQSRSPCFNSQPSSAIKSTNTSFVLKVSFSHGINARTNANTQTIKSIFFSNHKTLVLLLLKVLFCLQ